MREKELRLAIVLTGGVSLAIYMHGVTKELLKLVRASKIYHSQRDRDKRSQGAYEAFKDASQRETDTEEVYFELLQELAKEVELRVVIDVISGASAGGVNGVMLARALAHDLSLDAHKTMWLEHADVLELMDEKTKAGRWSKFYLEPFFRGPFYRYFAKLAPEDETREKLFTFMKSRWFSPPFSGVKFSNWLFDASKKMEDGAIVGETLLPDGHQLDLFVSVTDFQGHNRVVELHDPPRAIETEHRVQLQYGFVKLPTGEIKSDFDHDMIPALVFASRATSSFPGAFPAMTLKEIDDVMASRNREWRSRDEFIHKNFHTLFAGGRDPEKAFFIDGSTVNDKPFAVAIKALSGRPAHRDVVRRLLFVDPEADVGETAPPLNVPNMFRVLLGALMEIPRNEPIRDELERLHHNNQKAQMLRKVIELSRPKIDNMVEQIIAQSHLEPTMQQIAEWRRTAHEKAAEEAGIAYESYFRLKLSRILARVEKLISGFLSDEGRDDLKFEVRKVVNKWADLRILALRIHGVVRGPQDIAFLKNFDVDFYIRRIRFVIQRLNEFYHKPSYDGDDANSYFGLDEIKNSLYKNLDQAARIWSTDTYPEEIRKQAVSLMESNDTTNALDQFLEALHPCIDMASLDQNADEIFSVLSLNYAGPETRQDLLMAYVGFSFYDLLSFPLIQEEDLIELDEVLIHRISIKDAKLLRRDDKPIPLKGKALRNFGGFFNRSFREHDYLMGRLTAADRLVDVVLDAELEMKDRIKIDADRIKKRLFAKILDAEENSLKQDPELIATLREELL